jgi:hypothetical protein
MRKKTRVLFVGFVVTVGLALSSATSAFALGYIYTPQRTCSGASFVYTTAVASGNHFHTHIGATIRERTFEGLPYVYKTTRYYSGAQGTYKGLIGANVFGDVKSAAIGCDY